MRNIIILLINNFRSKILFAGISFLFFICFSFLSVSNLMAQGNLLITPHRVVFEGQKRVMEMSLANVGQDSAKYSISFLQYRTTDDGDYVEITTPDPGQRFADKNIRVYPRSVMLGPNETQVIKLQLTKTEQLEPGEYRSHIYFRAIPNQKALGEQDAKKDSTTITIKITPIFGITIPVLIRVGESTTTVNITDLKIETTAEGINKLLFCINRQGNMSAYGDITVSHISQNGKETVIGLLKGVAVYTPNLLRRLKVDLENKSSVDLSKGTIRVLFSSQSDIRTEKLAEAELKL
jgi:P pilus assembly chaperone PapD